ncbi:MAG: hypothetical protein J7K65_07845 [Planctomycetes bacterium]|nr:hypothetical protein [Planctomycetota bacterium]
MFRNRLHGKTTVRTRAKNGIKKAIAPIIILTLTCSGGCAVKMKKAAIDLNKSHFASYHIGNSLTWDMQPLGLAELARQRNYEHETGYHIECGKPLKHIWNNPKSTCVAPVKKFGYFDDALPNHSWDLVSIQPYSGDSTLLDDEEVILKMIKLAQGNPKNKNTRFYIYAAWPKRGNYQTKWTTDVSENDRAATVLAREYFKHLIERVRSRTTAQVFMIPVGEVLYELDKKLKAGEVPGYTSVDQMYRDTNHLSLDIGRFTAATTTFVTVYGSDPIGIVQPAMYYGEQGAQFTPEVYTAIYSTVRDVVFNSPYTGVSVR